jgi:hypothetical protein
MARIWAAVSKNAMDRMLASAGPADTIIDAGRQNPDPRARQPASAPRKQSAISSA